MEFSHELVEATIRHGIEAALKRNFFVACGIVDASGRTCGVIRHAKALYVTPDFALGKARLASAYRTSTGPMFARLQKDRPLYGATVASLNAQNQWFLAEGGAAIKLDDVKGEHHGGECVGAIGIAGCFPAAIDQEVADEVVEWFKTQAASAR